MSNEKTLNVRLNVDKRTVLWNWITERMTFTKEENAVKRAKEGFGASFFRDAQKVSSNELAVLSAHGILCRPVGGIVPPHQWVEYDREEGTKKQWDLITHRIVPGRHAVCHPNARDYLSGGVGTTRARVADVVPLEQAATLPFASTEYVSQDIRPYFPKGTVVTQEERHYSDERDMWVIRPKFEHLVKDAKSFGNRRSEPRTEPGFPYVSMTTLNWFKKWCEAEEAKRDAYLEITRPLQQVLIHSTSLNQVCESMPELNKHRVTLYNLICDDAPVATLPGPALDALNKNLHERLSL